MAEVLVFHHGHGLTTGVRDFAGRLRGAGHTVHVPDLYEGQVFATLEEGIAHAGRPASTRSRRVRPRPPSASRRSWSTSGSRSA